MLPQGGPLGHHIDTIMGSALVFLSHVHEQRVDSTDTVRETIIGYRVYGIAKGDILRASVKSIVVHGSSRNKTCLSHGNEIFN